MVTINISNRWLYTFALGIAVLALSVSVYAYNSGGPASYIGHSTDELEGVCLTDGTNCPDLGGGSLWDLNVDRVYYNDGWVGVGTSTPSTKLAVVDGVISSKRSTGDQSGLILGIIQGQSAGAVLTSGSTQGYETLNIYAEPITMSGDLNVGGDLDVTGRISSLVASGYDIYGFLDSSHTTGSFQSGTHCRDLGAHDFCVLSLCGMKDIDGGSESGSCYLTSNLNLNGPQRLWSVCSDGFPAGDDSAARAGAYCVDF